MRNTLVGCFFFACIVAGCSGSDKPSDPGKSGVSSDLVGTWQTDTSSVTYPAPPSSTQLRCHATFRFKPDSTYDLTIQGDSAFSSALQGVLYQESGTWSSVQTGGFTLHPALCRAADTATNSIGSTRFALPFKQTGTYLSMNDPVRVTCPETNAISFSPSSGVFRAELRFDLPPLGLTPIAFAFHG